MNQPITSVTKRVTLHGWTVELSELRHHGTPMLTHLSLLVKRDGQAVASVFLDRPRKPRTRGKR